MHIAILYQYYLGKGESGHSRVNEYARIWSQEGNKVSVLTGQASYMTGEKGSQYKGKLCVLEEDSGVDVYRCYVPNKANTSFLRRAWGYFSFAASSALAYRKLHKPDVLLVSSPPLTIGLAALLIKKFSRIPMIFEVRDLWPESAVTTGVLTSKAMIRFLSWLEKACYRKASRIVTLTTAFRENILGRNLALESVISHIPCGVDIDEMNPAKASDAIRAEFGWTGKFVALYTGAVGRANKLAQLIDAAALLRERDDILIAVVGDGMEREALKDRAEREGLRNIVFHGPQPKERMPVVTASADICTAVLMKNDTFKTVYPNKVFDYMACGKAVVLGIDGLIRKLVEESGCGLFVEPENPRALADALVRLADSSEERCSMGSRGRALVESRFDRRAVARDYLALLKTVGSGR